MTKYLKMFLMDGNDGVETIEFIGVIVVAAVLIAVVATIAGNTVTQLGNEGGAANDNMVGVLDELGSGADTGSYDWKSIKTE